MARPICKCGATLEEGFMGILWCPKCGGDWEMPEGVTPETHPEYYMTMTVMSKEETDKVREQFHVDA